MIKSEQNFFYSHIYQSIIKTNQLTFQDIFNTDFMDKINNDYTLKLDSINILKMLPKIAFEFLISENDKDSYIKKLKNLDFFEKELSPFFAMLCGLESIKSIFNEKLAIRLVIRSKEKINKYLNEYEKASRAEVDSVDFIDCFVPIFSSFKIFIESVNKEFEIIIEKYKSYVKNTIQINELFLKDYNESKKENVNYLMFEPALMNKYYDLKNIFFESLISYLNNKDLASLNNLSNTEIIADTEYKQFNDNRFTISYKSFNEYFKSKLLDAMLKTRKIFLDRLKKTKQYFSLNDVLRNDFLNIDETNLLKQIFTLALLKNLNARKFLKDIIYIFDDQNKNNLITIVENPLDLFELNVNDLPELEATLKKYYGIIKKLKKIIQKNQRK
ncbi:hypothetical protein GVAV_001182 [Gurleya vavrai]